MRRTYRVADDFAFRRVERVPSSRVFAVYVGRRAVHRQRVVSHVLVLRFVKYYGRYLRKILCVVVGEQIPQVLDKECNEENQHCRKRNVAQYYERAAEHAEYGAYRACADTRAARRPDAYCDARVNGGEADCVDDVEGEGRDRHYKSDDARSYLDFQSCFGQESVDPVGRCQRVIYLTCGVCPVGVFRDRHFLVERRLVGAYPD